MVFAKKAQMLGFWLASTFLSLCHFTVGQTAEDLECFSKWGQLNFNSTNFEAYPTYFDNDSFIHLAPAGQYVGPVDIEEYVKFATPFSELIASGVKQANTGGYWGRTEEGLCSFYSFFIIDYTMSSYGGGATNRASAISRLNLNASTSKIREWYVYYDLNFLGQFFGSLDTNATAEYLCNVMENNCPDTWSFNNFTTPKECLDAYKELPLVDTNSAIDGKSKGCRILHGSFAKYNDKHCPHLSIAPQADFKGREKCQYSQGLPLDSHFSAEQIVALNAFVTAQQATAPTTAPTPAPSILIGSCSHLRARFAFFALFVGLLSL